MRNVGRYIVVAGTWLTTGGCLEVEGTVPEVCFEQRNIQLDPTALLDESVDLTDLLPEAYALDGSIPEGYALDGGIPELQGDQATALARVLGEKRIMRTSFTIDAADELDFLTDDSLGADAYLKRVKFTLTEGDVTSFNFLSALVVEMQVTDVNSSLPPITWLNCTADTCDFESNTLTQDFSQSDNFVDYLTAGPLDFTMLFEGYFPTEGWTLDAEMCFGASIEHRVF